MSFQGAGPIACRVQPTVTFPIGDYVNVFSIIRKQDN